MTSREMQEAFAIQVSKVRGRAPLESDDIFYWLNAAQEKFVRDRFLSLERTQDVTDDIRPLKVMNKAVATSYVNGTGVLDEFFIEFAAFPDDYLFLISCRAKVAYHVPEIEYVLPEAPDGGRTPDGEHTDQIVPCRISQQDDVYALLRDPFNTTKRKKPLVVQNATGVSIYSDKTFIPEVVYLDYLKSPAPISVSDDSELPEFVHRALVELAVTLFLRSAVGGVPDNSPGVQTSRAKP